MINKKEALIFPLSNSKEISKTISKKLDIPIAKVSINKFADGETLISSETSVRGKCVFLIQSTCAPVNDSVMELFIAMDAIRRASASSIVAIIPYYGYARQDRKAQGREPITSRMIANFIETSKADRVLTLDIHSDQQQGFFSIPFDSLSAIWIILKKLFEQNKYNMKNITIVSPDHGGVKRARAIANVLGVPIAIVDKRRPAPNQVEIQNILGDIKGRDCILPDDMIDTGGTMISVANILRKKGAKSISIVATHGLFSKDAVNKFDEAFKQKIIDNLYVSNSIETNQKPKKASVVDVAPLLADAIKIYMTGTGSISSIYEKYKHFKK